MTAPNILLLLPERLRADAARAAAAGATRPEARVGRAVARQPDEQAWRAGRIETGRRTIR